MNEFEIRMCVYHRGNIKSDKGCLSSLVISNGFSGHGGWVVVIVAGCNGVRYVFYLRFLG